MRQVVKRHDGDQQPDDQLEGLDRMHPATLSEERREVLGWSDVPA